MTTLPYIKASALGNTFLIVDKPIPSEAPPDWPAVARAMCDPSTGPGADGLIRTDPGEPLPTGVTAATMRLWNADGSTAEVSGNGLRCLALVLHQTGRARAGGSQGFLINTDSGPRTCWIDPDQPQLVRTQLGHARFGPQVVHTDSSQLEPLDNTEHGLWRIDDERAHLVSVGNPHAVVMTDAPLDNAELERRGAALERHPAFTNRINASFARIESSTRVHVQTWERGVGATPACASGAIATIAALARAGTVEPQAVAVMEGGELHVEVDPDGALTQTGPAHIVERGQWPA